MDKTVDLACNKSDYGVRNNKVHHRTNHPSVSYEQKREDNMAETCQQNQESDHVRIENICYCMDNIQLSRLKNQSFSDESSIQSSQGSHETVGYNCYRNLNSYAKCQLRRSWSEDYLAQDILNKDSIVSPTNDSGVQLELTSSNMDTKSVNLNSGESSESIEQYSKVQPLDSGGINQMTDRLSDKDTTLFTHAKDKSSKEESSVSTTLDIVSGNAPHSALKDDFELYSEAKLSGALEEEAHHGWNSYIRMPSYIQQASMVSEPIINTSGVSSFDTLDTTVDSAKDDWAMVHLGPPGELTTDETAICSEQDTIKLIMNEYASFEITKTICPQGSVLRLPKQLDIELSCPPKTVNCDTSIEVLVTSVAGQFQAQFQHWDILSDVIKVSWGKPRVLSEWLMLKFPLTRCLDLDSLQLMYWRDKKWCVYKVGDNESLSYHFQLDHCYVYVKEESAFCVVKQTEIESGCYA